MKRVGIAIMGALMLLSAAVPAGAASLPIKGSKHDLSVATGPGPIKSASLTSGGTSEICVFCHTPHSGTIEAPLWNRSLSLYTYVTYTSDVMASLNYTLESPQDMSSTAKKAHLKTRICMSCHDGTIAMGVLANYPPELTGEIPISGSTGGKMPGTAAGYIGTDLRDSHPVAVKHNTGQDPELKAIDTSTKVRVYDANGNATQANNDYVECTSCHDAHDNQYGNFLVDDNVGSKICRACHDKAGDDSSVANESVHSNPTYVTSYSPTTNGTPGNIGGSVETVKCMDCHYPHKAGMNTYNGNAANPNEGKYLLTYQQEMTCFNNTNRWGQPTTVCHGSGATSTKRLDDQVTKSSAHKVGTYSATSSKPHNATEGSAVSVAGTGWLGVTGNSWHVECDDCHNSHTAGKLAHTAPGNGVTTTSDIYGAGGAEPPASYTAWSVPAANAYTYIEPIGVLRISGTNLGVTKEYQICLKCHSSFAWGTSGPSSVPTSGLTDQALEFNTANDSFHPVFAANSKNSAGTFNASSPWNGGTQTMYCSDCHGNDSASPKGPHGSAKPYLLTTPYVDTYPTSTNPSQNQPNTNDLCWNCHDVATYLTGADNYNPGGTGFSTGNGTGNNLHTRHKTLAASSPSSLFAYRCVNCHSRVPHGYGDSGARPGRAMIVLQNAGFPYEASAGGGKITAPLAFPAQKNYTTRDATCSTVAGCHH